MNRTHLGDIIPLVEAKLPVLREQARMLEIRGRQIHAGISMSVVLGGGYEAGEVGVYE